MIRIGAWLIVIISAVGLVISLMVGPRQSRERDEPVGSTRARHTLLANPVLIAYVLFPILIVIGAAVAIIYNFE